MKSVERKPDVKPEVFDSLLTLAIDETKRIEALLIYDILRGNPNGNPDDDNKPRLLPDERIMVTDVCISRKLRNYIDAVYGDQEGYAIHVRQRGFREDNQKEAMKLAKGDRVKAREIMCRKYWDIRIKGSVLPGKEGGEESWNMGQVRGPLQLGLGVSVDVVEPEDINISCISLQNRSEENTGEDGNAKHGTFGSKWILPYALFVQPAFWNPTLGAQTGVTRLDFLRALEALSGRMWDIDRSAGRAEMMTRGLIVFQHDSLLGNAPAQELFDLVKIEKTPEALSRIEKTPGSPTSFADYKITVCGKEMKDGDSLTHKDDARIPQGVTIMRVGYARQVLTVAA
jgi:CRISPR-associated protein Csd2